MRIIREKKLREFWKETSLAENAMKEWIEVVKPADWHNFADLKNSFNHADVYKKCVIFDVGGNKYRIIGIVEYKKHIVFIRYVLTHAEYDKDKWCFDCE